MPHSLPTKLLHGFLAASIIHQLVVSQFMTHPRPGRPGDFAFDLHSWVGLASMGVVGAFWLWVLVRRREHGVAALVPWFSALRRRAVFADAGRHLHALKQLTLPPPGDAETPLPSAVHGLGLLTATAMAATGTAAYFLSQPDGSLASPGRLVLEVHEIFANLTWAYLIAHAGLALLHQMLGHRLLQRMFTGQE
jgi:cytochrome b561